MSAVTAAGLAALVVALIYLGIESIQDNRKQALLTKFTPSRSSTASVSSAGLYTTSTCTGLGVRGATWKTASCEFRNLCYNPSDKTFIYHRAEGDTFDPATHSVSLGAPNAQWSEKDRERIKFAPTVVSSPIDPAVKMGQSNLTYVIHTEHCAANVMHLIMDSFFLWYQLATAFGKDPATIYPLRVPMRNPGLWGTCDYILEEEKKGTPWARGYYRRCTSNLRKWLPTMVRGLTEVPSTDEIKETTCFPRAVIGGGMFSDHCLRAHGWHWDPNDPSLHDCNQGRGPMLWGFRRHMMTTAGISLPTPPVTGLRVALLSGGARGGTMWPSLTKEVNDMVARETHAGKVHLWKGDLARMSAKEQMEAMASVAVAVVAMGGNSVSSLFFPRGAAVVMLHDDKDWLDWDLWGHTSWMRVTWVKVSLSEVAKVMGIIRSELRTASAFIAVDPQHDLTGPFQT